MRSTVSVARSCATGALQLFLRDDATGHVLVVLDLGDQAAALARELLALVVRDELEAERRDRTAKSQATKEGEGHHGE